MEVPPVIIREMRVAVRSPWHYVLRLTGALAAVVLAWTVVRQNIVFPDVLGNRLFVNFASTFHLLIFCIAPLLTADCLSCEKREGTLGLLFLTSLSGMTIVFQKAYVHMVQGLVFCLASVPVLTIPFFLGGIVWMDILNGIVFGFSSLLLALAAGMLASCLFMKPLAAVIIAEILAWICAGILGQLIDFGMRFSLTGLAPASYSQLADYVGYWKLRPPYLAVENLSWGQIFLGAPVAIEWNWILFLFWILATCSLMFLLALTVCTRRVESHWQDTPKSARTEQWHKTWFSPRFWQNAYQQYRIRMLRNNPLGWLQRYAVRSRLTTIGWCAIILLTYSLLISCKQPWVYYDSIQMWLILLIVLHMCNDAATHLNVERDSGLLELMLITPLSIMEILWGRLCSFWRRFTLPAILIIGLSEWMIWRDIANSSIFGMYQYLLIGLLTAPCIGFYFSIRLRNSLLAVLVNILIVGLLPLIIPEIGNMLYGFEFHPRLPWFFDIIGHPSHSQGMLERFVRWLQIALASWSFFAVFEMLRLRSFAFRQPFSWNLTKFISMFFKTARRSK